MREEDSITGWSVIASPAGKYVGRILDREDGTTIPPTTIKVISPVYELMYTQGPNPQTGQGWVLGHMLGYPLADWSMTEFPLPPAALVMSIEKLHPDLQKIIARSARAMEEVRREYRLRSSGITVAKEIPPKGAILPG